MFRKLILRLWLSRLGRYLVVPLGLCIILLPLYGLLHQQTENAQFNEVSEQLSSAVSTFESYLNDVRYTTSKVFNDDLFMLLAASDDDSLTGDAVTPIRASGALQDYTYRMSHFAYSYVTFARNHVIVDEYRDYRGYDSFYPGALEFSQLTESEWLELLSVQELTIVRSQDVILNRTSYPNAYLTVIQPFFNSGGQFRGTYTVLLREKMLSDLFLPMEKWRRSGVFCIFDRNGSPLLEYQYDGSELPSAGAGLTSMKYDGEKYLFVSREIPSIGATAVVGLPYSVYAENLQAVNRAIVMYLFAGLIGCLLLSAWMTLWDVRQLRPLLETLDDAELQNNRLLNDLLAQKLRSHTHLVTELMKTRGELEHSRVEALLKTGALSGSAEEQKNIREQMHLTDYNYLLLLSPQPREDAHVSEELRLMMISELVHQCYGRHQFVYNTTDGSVLVILTLETGTEAEQVRMCRQTEELYTRMNMTEPVILSGRFTKLEQLSSVYWQARNMAAFSDHTQKVCYLNGESLMRVTTTDIIRLEQLNEYLLSGRVQEAQTLIGELFHVDDLSPQNFQQAFYSVRGVLIAAAQKVDCPEAAHLCTYDNRQSVQHQVQNLRDCCFEICSHVDSLKRSHNEELQQRIVAWLDENYARQDLNPARIAEQFQVSKKYVSQFLKDQTGKSYSEYVEDLRLTHAMQMLRETELGVTEISRACGFSTQNTFYKAFRRRFGISPSMARHGSEEE